MLTENIEKTEILWLSFSGYNISSKHGKILCTFQTAFEYGCVCHWPLNSTEHNVQHDYLCASGNSDHLILLIAVLCHQQQTGSKNYRTKNGFCYTSLQYTYGKQSAGTEDNWKGKFTSSFLSQVVQGPEQPDLMSGISAHGRGVGRGRSLGSIPTWATLGYDSMKENVFRSFGLLQTSHLKYLMPSNR